MLKNRYMLLEAESTLLLVPFENVKYLQLYPAPDNVQGHTYIKGFLRTYADALGMDGQLYVDEYNSRFVTGEDEAPLRTHRVPSQGHVWASATDSGDRGHCDGCADGLVFAAWKFGGTAEPRVQGINVPPATTPAAVARCLVTATKGAFMEVRRTGAGRPSLTLERGQTKRFATSKLTLSFASPQRRRARRRCPGRGAEGWAPHGPSSLKPSRRDSRHGRRLVRGERTDLNGPFYVRPRLGNQPVRLRSSATAADRLPYDGASRPTSPRLG